MKKIFAILLSLLMLAGLFTGCKSSKAVVPAPGSGNTPAPGANADPAAQVDTSDPAAIFRAASDQSKNWRSVHMKLDYPVTMDLSYSGQSIQMDFNIQAELDMTADPIMIHGNLTMDVMGQYMEMELYGDYEDGQMITYYRETGTDTFIRKTQDAPMQQELGGDFTGLEGATWTMEETDTAYILHTEITADMMQSMLSTVGDAGSTAMEMTDALSGDTTLPATFTVDKQTLQLRSCEMDAGRMMAEALVAQGYGITVNSCSALIVVTYSDYNAVGPITLPTDYVEE